MNFFKKIISTLFILKPKSIPFFYALASMHIFFKVFLGLTLIFKSGYTFFTLVAPPQSLLLASAGIVLSYATAKLFELIPQKIVKKVQIITLFIFFFFLTANFIVHSYFKTFINYGLIMFNGAGFVELLNYTLAAINIFSLSFIILSIGAIIFFIGAKNYKNKKHTQIILFFLLIFFSLAWPGIGENTSHGMQGWLLRNPLMDLIDTTISEIKSNHEEIKNYKIIKNFKVPQKPIFGHYKTDFNFKKPELNHPNVLFILTESLPFYKTPLNPHTKIKFPTIKKLMNRSIVFKSFYTVFPATSRSFITYHCGIYPNSGTETISKYKPDFDCDSILKRVKKAGYKTGFFTASMFTYDNLNKTKLLKTYDVYKDFFSMQKEAKHNGITAQAVEEEVVIKELVKFLTKTKQENKPFFATYFAFWDHAPYRLPFRDISNLPFKKRYEITLHYLDKIFAQLFSQLEKEGLLKNTIIIFSADHGEGFGEHGNYNHVGNVYQGDIHIPLLISLPGQTESIINNRLTSNVDFAPTLFSLMNLKKSTKWEGQDVLSNNYVAKPVLFFSRSSFYTNGIIDGNYKYFYYFSSNKQYLFDIFKDPKENNNLIKEKKEMAKKYREIVDKWTVFQDWKIIYGVSDESVSTKNN